MPSPSLILSVALAASFVPLSNLSRSHYHSARRRQEAAQPFAENLANLSKYMEANLRRDRVIPEVIAHVPPRPVAVFYPYATVLMGNEIDPSALRHVPKFAFETRPNKRYTIFLLGPDYPSRSNPYERSHVMWFLTNYARNSTHEYRPICRISYEQPRVTRNSGRTRFVFLVYDQPDDIDWSRTLLEAPSPNINFMLDSYVSQNRLTLLAANYFVINMDKEESETSNPSVKKSPPGRITHEESSDTAEKKGNGVGEASEGGKNSGSGTDSSGDTVTGDNEQHDNVEKSAAGGRSTSDNENSAASDKNESDESRGRARTDRDSKEKTSSEDKLIGTAKNNSDDASAKSDEEKAISGGHATASAEKRAITDNNTSSEDIRGVSPSQYDEAKATSDDKSASVLEKKSGEEKSYSDDKKTVRGTVDQTKTGSGEARNGVDGSALDTVRKEDDVGKKQSHGVEKDSGPGEKYVESGKTEPTGTGNMESKEKLTAPLTGKLDYLVQEQDDMFENSALTGVGNEIGNGDNDP
ncbi:hypothetical protein HPB50_012492 [Hyalomma asiaticum]|uniref:Uncharacterized protein n=1 Tax=Hyalomma asiaticum TaxID=266040 RepID=A0ACB7SGR7_HYAAI|nr:hypothetical protein HPB50_012492 [Hyalomma asiaticum]